jgi:hypothetical protein
VYGIEQLVNSVLFSLYYLYILIFPTNFDIVSKFHHILTFKMQPLVWLQEHQVNVWFSKVGQNIMSKAKTILIT